MTGRPYPGQRVRRAGHGRAVYVVAAVYCDRAALHAGNREIDYVDIGELRPAETPYLRLATYRGRLIQQEEARA